MGYWLGVMSDLGVVAHRASRYTATGIFTAAFLKVQ
jgi:hypothetical protein